MSKIGMLHTQMASLIKKIRNRHNTQSPKIKQYIQNLMDVCDQYLIEIAIADHITYLEFYNIVDVIEDNINFLKQKYLNGINANK
jgi:hypothetical protein